MIKPTIGRVVWYYRPGSFTQQPNAALIAHVWSDELVNLAVFDSNGVASNETSVALFQGDGQPPSTPYCGWMPYQVGQAAKTEAVEKQLTEMKGASAGI